EGDIRRICRDRVELRGPEPLVARDAGLEQYGRKRPVQPRYDVDGLRSGRKEPGKLRSRNREAANQGGIQGEERQFPEGFRAREEISGKNKYFEFCTVISAAGIVAIFQLSRDSICRLNRFLKIKRKRQSFCATHCSNRTGSLCLKRSCQPKPPASR